MTIKPLLNFNNGADISADPSQIFALQSLNRALIQGPQDFVDSTYNELKAEIDAGKKVLRNLAYRWLRPLGFVAFLMLSFIELRLFQFLRPDFTIQTPLTGLSVVLSFTALLINVQIVFSTGARVTSYLFPYFELEDRLSESRKDLRKLWAVTIVALYGGGVRAVAQALAR